MTFTRTHTHVTYANPNLVCTDCGAAAEGFHDPERCGCTGGWSNTPCGHQADTKDTCPSWGPVDGCTCEGHPHADRLPLPPESGT